MVYLKSHDAFGDALGITKGIMALIISNFRGGICLCKKRIFSTSDLLCPKLL